MTQLRYRKSLVLERGKGEEGKTGQEGGGRRTWGSRNSGWNESNGLSGEKEKTPKIWGLAS